MTEETSTEWMECMLHRKQRETKQQPSMPPGPAVPGCCSVSFHVPCDIHSIHSVILLSKDISKGQLLGKGLIYGTDFTDSTEERAGLLRPQSEGQAKPFGQG